MLSRICGVGLFKIVSKILNIENSYEHGCKPGSFNISEHPDYSNYIRKDKIPCWNCDLSNG